MEQKPINNLIKYEEVIDSYVDAQWEILLTRGAGPKTQELFDKLDKKIERILPWLTNKIFLEPRK